MSLFLLTNSHIKAEKAFSIWSDLFGKAQTESLNDKCQLVTTAGFKDSEGFSHFTYPDGEVYGCGTFFDSKGFGQNIDANRARLLNFDQHSVESLFGHYAFIICNDQSIRIVTDPIGVINIFWAKTDQEFFISNDCLLVAALSENHEISKNASLQFIFDKFTHGSATLFKNVNRLKVGHQLLIENKKLKEESFHEFIPEKLTLDEYVDRIDFYFDMISTYQGKIISDISAGHDSRLVTACAAKHIPDLLTCTNDTRTDDGADLKYGKIISEELNLKHFVLTEDNDPSSDLASLLHTFTPFRDLKTSEMNFWKNKQRYQLADLNIVGQNVDIIRWPYPERNPTKGWMDHHFSGQSLQRFGITSYSKHLSNNFKEEYFQQWIESYNRLDIWIFIMSYQRIICDSPFSGKFLMGDVLSPLLDWHLVAPILSWDFEKLNKNKLYFKILNRYHSSLTKLPINPGKNISESPEKSTSIWRKIGQKILTYLPNEQRRERKTKIRQQYEIMPRDKFDPNLLSSLGLTLQQLEKYSKNHELDRIGRLATIQIARDRVLELSELPT